MQIKFSNRGTILIVNINGELDHHSAEYLREKIDAQIIKSTTKNILFDFSNVSFMDSSGIGVIMGRYKNIQRFNGKVAMVNLNAQIKRIFEMSGLFKLIPFYENVDHAITFLGEAV
ncbi:MAG: anti-sigma F factor antagonist [Clostridia bacterium]|nr:anti-sigma F factor antagonist [Clostridia bacterium]